MLSGAQVRAARALLRWTVADLARESRVSVPTIHRLEQVDDVPAVRERTLHDLKRAFEDAGIEFIGTPEEPGLVLHPRRSASP